MQGKAINYLNASGIVVSILLLLTTGFESSASELTLDQTIQVCENSNGDHQPADAVKTCSDLLESGHLTDEDRAGVLVSRGNSLYETRDFNAAVQDYEQAVELDPASTVARGRKALAFVAIGRVRQAQRDILELVADAAPHQEDVLMEHVRELATTSAPHRNGELARRLIEIADPAQDKNPDILETMAAAYAADRKYEIAVRLQYRAIKLAEQKKVSDLSGYVDRFKLYKSSRALVCPDLPECW